MGYKIVVVSLFRLVDFVDFMKFAFLVLSVEFCEVRF